MKIDLVSPKSPVLDAIEERLAKLLSIGYIGQETLVKTAQYSSLGKAKRIRPKMTMAIGGAKALDVAVVIELIHTYSLIHDDLPCMDNDAVRRGKPSLHIAFPESTALLTGDFLLTFAFEMLSKAPYSPEIRCKLIQVISKAIGSQGMIGGQLLDLAAKKEAISWEEYQMIASKKTSALFIAALECGGIIAGLDKPKMTILYHFGQVFGLLFQIADDLEDDDLPSAKAILGEVSARETLALLTKNAGHLLDLLQIPVPYLRDCLSL